jgi:putative DNA primase/helicase
VTLSQDHRDYLLAAAITPEVINASGIHTREKEPRGIVFPWNDGHQDEPLPQLRPDVPKEDDKGRPIKYRFPAGAKMILNRLRDCGDGPALIVEGTKQQYAALSHAPEDHAVYGLSGCWNWVDADLTWALDRDVYVLFDGDVTTNKDVHQAATEFAEKLDLSGARSVRYVRTTARGTDGLDDVLAKLPEDKRAQYLGLWISKATDKLPKAPAKKDANPFFEKGSLQAEKAARALLERQPAALTVERKVALYLGGSYHIDGTAFLSAVSKQLGDQFRPAWRATLEEMAVGLLFDGGKVLPERSAFAELNCLNGMLNLRTLELKSHDPDYFSTVQVPVEWDPDARAPHYERWLMSVCPLQVDDLEEVAGTMLDPTRTADRERVVPGVRRAGQAVRVPAQLRRPGGSGDRAPHHAGTARDPGPVGEGVRARPGAGRVHPDGCGRAPGVRDAQRPRGAVGGGRLPDHGGGPRAESARLESHRAPRKCPCLQHVGRTERGVEDG